CCALLPESPTRSLLARCSDTAMPEIPRVGRRVTLLLPSYTLASAFLTVLLPTRRSGARPESCTRRAGACLWRSQVGAALLLVSVSNRLSAAALPLAAMLSPTPHNLRTVSAAAQAVTARRCCMLRRVGSPLC